MYSEKEILELIKQGENSAVEFKSATVNAESLAKEIVAFSNMSGGIIMLGVEDDGSVTGIDESKEEWVMNIARQNVIPPVNLSYQELSIGSRQLAVVNIEKGLNKPYQTNKFHYLVRIGSTNRVASQLELMRLFQKSGVYHYDSVEVEETSFSDLNFTKLDEYFSQYEIEISKEPEEEKIKLLKNTDIFTENNHVTVGGLLIFGINPQRYLYNASISFAHFNGNEIDEELIDKQVITGTLDFQVNQALAVIKNNIHQPSVISGTKTVDVVPQYPDKVYRELVLNACIHRNYSISGSRIRIFLFDNRIEFRSPGTLPNTVTIEKIKSGVSYSTNPVILKFMENLRYIDKLGRGLPMVCMEAKKLNKTVEFKEFGEEFIVTLYL